MLCHGFSVKIASPNSAALRMVDPSLSLESVAFCHHVGVPPQNLRLPRDSGPQEPPKLEAADFRLEQTPNTFFGRWPLPLTGSEALWLEGYSLLGIYVMSVKQKL